MLSFLAFLTNWAFRKKKTRQAPARRGVLLSLEALEDRCTPSSSTWIANAGGDWNVAANWSAGIPGVTPMVDQAVFTAVNNTNCNLNVAVTLKTIDISGYSASVNLSNSMTLDNPMPVGGSRINFGAGGSLTGPGLLKIQSGIVDWFSGTIAGTGLLHNAGGTFAINGSSAKVLNRNVDNGKDMYWNGGNVTSADIQVTNFAGATFTIWCDATWSLATSTNSLWNKNGGLVRKSVTGGTSTFEMNWKNEGTFNIELGTVKFTRTAENLDGQTSIYSNCTLEAPTYKISGGALFTNAAFATLKGNLQVTGGGVWVGDNLTPNGIGTLVITGNYTQSGGELHINADAAASTSDRLPITGTANLAGGVLHVHTTGTPGLGQTLSIMTAASFATDYAAIDKHFLPWASAGPAGTKYLLVG